MRNEKRARELNWRGKVVKKHFCSIFRRSKRKLYKNIFSKRCSICVSIYLRSSHSLYMFRAKKLFLKLKKRGVARGEVDELGKREERMHHHQTSSQSAIIVAPLLSIQTLSCSHALQARLTQQMCFFLYYVHKGREEEQEEFNFV